MPLTLHPMTPSDALSYTRIRTAAWAGPTQDMLYTRPLSESSLRGVAENTAREIGKSGTWYWKVVDTDSDEYERIIAVAVWSMCNIGTLADHDRESESEREKDEEENEDSMQIFTPPELRRHVRELLVAPFAPLRADIMGTSSPYLMLNTLATHPAHQSRGAGTMLLEWGLKKADQEGLKIYVESKERSRGVYERRGFVLVKSVEFDRAPWGGEGRDWHGCMVREPAGAK